MLASAKTPLLLALDQGTTNTKALLVNQTGAVVFRTGVPVPLATPQPGFVEQDPETLWQSVLTVINASLNGARALGGEIAGIALTNQRETALAWDRHSGIALAPAVSWQCRRSQSVCQRVRDVSDTLRGISGLPLDPVLSCTKWAWMLEKLSAVQQASHGGTLCLGTVDSWLLARLTSGALHATDVTNASRTGLLDLRTLGWSAPMVERFGIPAAALPEVLPSAGLFGHCTALDSLAHVPITCVLGDSHAALAGHGAFTPGTLKATYGTGSSLMTLTPNLPLDTSRLARTAAWSTAHHTQYALEGNIFMTGSAVQWVGEFLGFADPVEGALALATTVDNTAGMYLVPAMVGLGAPHWQAAARGFVCGMERSHTAAHMARAALEAVAFQVADVFYAMQDVMGTSLPCLHVDGGATRNQHLMQLQADLLGVPVVRSETEELSALGAAYLGGLALGWWPSLEVIAALPRPTACLQPGAETGAWRDRYAGWQQAVRRAMPEAGNA